jgi:nucleoside-diphosphate-sugar epimerase
MRQKSNFGFAKVLKEVVKYTYEECLYHIEVEVSNEAAPWVYAEDVASFIWYLIEQKDFGKNGRIVRIPHLGITSVKLMAEVAQKILGKHIDYEIVEPWKQFVLNYECDVKTNWIPDSKNMEESLKKTINWYIANQWIFNI